MKSVREALVSLYNRNDPSTFRWIHLDRHSRDQLEYDRDAYFDMGVSERDRARTWRGIPITVEAAPLELHAIGPAEVPEDIGQQIVERERQITIECRRRDNNRVFYLDDEDNSPVWKLQGAPE